MKHALKSVVPRPVWERMKRSKKRASRALRATAERGGFSVARTGDFYSPLPVESQIRKNAPRWNTPSDLLGVEYDLDGFRTLTSSIIGKFYPEFGELPDHSEVAEKGFGLGYPAVDALTLYAMYANGDPPVILRWARGSLLTTHRSPRARIVRRATRCR